MYSIAVLAAFGTLGVANAVKSYVYIIVGGGTTGLVVANSQKGGATGGGGVQ